MKTPVLHTSVIKRLTWTWKMKEEGTKTGNVFFQPRWNLNCIWCWEASTLWFFFFCPYLCGNYSLFVSCLLLLTSAMWCLWGQNDRSCQTWLLMACSWFSWAPASLFLLFFPSCWFLFVFFLICMVHWWLMLSASDWEDCCWHAVLSIMNLFLSTFLKCCSRRHLISCIGSW